MRRAINGNALSERGGTEEVEEHLERRTLRRRLASGYSCVRLRQRDREGERDLRPLKIRDLYRLRSDRWSSSPRRPESGNDTSSLYPSSIWEVYNQESIMDGYGSMYD